MAQHNMNLFFESDIEGENIQRKFLSFLNDFSREDEDDPNTMYYPYKKEATRMANNKRTTMRIDFRDLTEYSGTFDLAEVIHLEFYKYDEYLRKGLTQFMFDLQPDYAKDKAFYISIKNLAETDT